MSVSNRYEDTYRKRKERKREDICPLKKKTDRKLAGAATYNRQYNFKWEHVYPILPGPASYEFR